MTIYIGGQHKYFFISTSNLARIATKLCENAFQTIPNVSFFDAEKIGEHFRSKNIVKRKFQTDLLAIFFFGVEKWNVGNRPKRVFPKFGGCMGQVWRENCAKLFAYFFFRRQKMKRWESSETRFGQVSRRSEPSSRGKWPFKVSEIARTVLRRKTGRRDLRNEVQGFSFLRRSETLWRDL